MRKGHKYIEVDWGEPARRSIDSSVAEFASGMGYAKLEFKDPEAFLAHFRQPWVLELHDALRSLLSPGRAVIGIGSGSGEHELLLSLAGYDVTASDVVDPAFAPARDLFPGFRAIHLDIFDPPQDQLYDDVLVAGLDSYFDAERAQAIFVNAKQLLRPEGRLIFTLRYHDNSATRLIDTLLLPTSAALRRLHLRLTGSDLTVVKKEHGYRRTRSEIILLGMGAGYRIGRIRHAGFAFEMSRIGLDRRTPRVYELLRKIDRRFNVLNNATVFEFLS